MVVVVVGTVVHVVSTKGVIVKGAATTRPRLAGKKLYSGAEVWVGHVAIHGRQTVVLMLGQQRHPLRLAMVGQGSGSGTVSSADPSGPLKLPTLVAKRILRRRLNKPAALSPG